MQDFQGKRVLITGGNSGIGRRAAEALAARGARVAVMGRDRKTLDETAAALGGGALVMQGDVSRLEDLDRAAGDVQSAFGGLDVLIANAGVCPMRPIDRVDEAFFDRVIGINLKGTYFTLQKCAPLLSEGASVVLVGSSGASKGLGGLSVYSASKAGVRALARSFSAEWLPRRIRVNVLSPGVAATPMVDRLDVPADVASQLTDNIRRMVPLQRLGETDEIVAALLFLASDASAYMLGADVAADGGLTAL